MPELPEVETIRRDLQSLLLHQTVADLIVHDSRFLSASARKKWAQTLTGQSTISFGRKGKYLWIEFSNRQRLFIHLRMTGQLIVSSDRADRPRMQLRFQSGKTLSLFDQRRFAEGWLLGPDELWRENNPLGPDALNELDPAGFAELLKGRTTRIHPLLLDQRRMAGVGNIYAQEALFKAAIRPTRASGRLSRAESGRLFEALRETLETAITHRGSSSRNYTDGTGQQGSAQMLHAVYRKGGTPCPRCERSLRSARVGGRGTVFCPGCQK